MIRTLFLLLLVSTSAFSQVNLNQGLIAHYPFNGDANDATGNNINGTVTNATLTTDKAGTANSAYHFNGTNAYIFLPYSNLYNFGPQDSFSISVWVLPEPGMTWPAQAVVVKAPPHADFTLSTWNYGIYLWTYNAMSGYAYNHILNGTTTLTPNPCWYNIITTYKNGNWRLYVNGVLESSDLSQTKFILQDGFSRISFGKKGESFGDWYKGKMDEVRIYNRVLNVDEVSAIAGTCLPPCPQKGDFTFSRNPCSPYEVTFSTNATSYNNIRWDFGDGNNFTGAATITNTYANPGNYQVVMITDYPTCSDTVKKTITVDLQNDNQLVITPDTTICFGTTKKIRTIPALSFCWSPTTFLDDPNIAEPTTSTPQNITYYYTAQTTGTNIIANGNFNSGNTGFTSQYIFANPNTTEGQYFVGPSPQAWNSSLSNCPDHTSGTGNMMLVNGSPVPNMEVWKQTVTVTPNTNYAFSTWIQALWPPNPAQLKFAINGVDVGNLITASLPTCTWTRFHTTWNSGNNTTAVISIVNKNTIVQGNDFALDDISFSPVFLKRDSVKITVEAPVVTTNNNSNICQGGSVQLNATGASTYSWSPATGLSSATIANPVATPATTTQYIVTGTTTNNCVAKDTVVITVFARPTVVTSADTTICENTSAQLFASGGTIYSWTPAATLNNSNIPNPIASPTVPTTYTVTVTDANNCSNTGSVSVDIRLLNNFTISPPTEVCLNQSVQLNASGGDLYTWSPAGSLNNAGVANPVATPLTTTIYTVQITDTLCSFNTSLSTTINVLPLPVVDAVRSNDIDCSNNQSQLNATGAIQFSWTPAGTLNNPLIANPIAMPVTTTQYTVTGTDIKGCVNTDTITVKVTATNKGGYLMASAFTPNGDGLNDCYGIRYWGIIESVEFSIYNRWGQRVFFSNNPQACWDGTFQGKKQGTDVFVYMIRAKTSCEPAVFRKGLVTLIR